jgi:hypothetical protein
MDPEDSQKTWEQYYARIRSRRVAEAQLVYSNMRDAGVTEETVFTLDFRHFTPEKASADTLLAQLSENYQLSLSHDPERNYWYIDGTTRPYGIELTESEFIGWTEFMADVAQSHGCVFSTWQLSNPETGESWSNGNIDVSDA